MNQKIANGQLAQSTKRGTLARKLLRAATRRAKSPNPLTLPLPADESRETMSGPARVLGPYKNGQKWRVIIREGKQRQSLVYDTQGQAKSVRDQLLASFNARINRLVGETIAEYLTHKSKRGCVEQTTVAIREKLSNLLPLEQTLGSITAHEAEHRYEALTEGVAVATHQKALREAKAFYRYCVKQKYVASNPFAEVQPVGKPNVGKLQLRTDEAKKLSDLLVKEASRGDMRALAVMLQILLGLRSGELLKLRKRDLDCRGTVIIVEGTKTKHARRALELDAPVVRDLLLRRCEKLEQDALLFAADGMTFPRRSTTLWKWVRLFCRQAGVTKVCPHSLRGLHSSLAVKAGATSSYVAQALGHGSDAVTRKHYIAPGALDSARSARVVDALLGNTDVDKVIAALRSLPSQQLDKVCAAVGVHR